MEYPKTNVSPGQHDLLTLRETALVLRCSRSHVYKIRSGKLHGLPPLPVLRIGRKTFVRPAMLLAWIKTLEAREREINYATGCFGAREDELEYIAGA